MLLSFQRLARNMTDQLLSQGRRAGVNSTIGSSFQFKKQAFTNGCPQDTSYEVSFFRCCHKHYHTDVGVISMYLHSLRVYTLFRTEKVVIIKF